MTEKEKSKHNPFVKELRPDEAILWLYKCLPLRLDVHLKQYVMTCVAGLLVISVLFGFLFFLIAMIYSAFNGLLIAWTFALGMSFILAFAAVGIALCPILLIGYPFAWGQEQRSQKAYAVTNHRLLTSANGHLSQMGLESISTVNSSKDTISFGQSGCWNSIEDTAEVAHLIRQAREERLKALKETAIA